MYKSFFGFRERPFKLVPNPAYLFLSKSHEEALAHLQYAVLQGDGFVEITGEVGTGKTTLCRTFLENLGEDAEAAYVFNPNLDPIQLLKSIHDEFGISSAAENTKDLIDILNGFLMERKAAGKKVVLLIDEAQNLTKGVLEQLRLLSNLETNTSKLLQIILVGQPELRETLDSSELRQLAQRITLSCRLAPLSYGETRDYVVHRIQQASGKPKIKFDRAALRIVHRYSGGIPRSINVVCDRALLTAFALNRHRISARIVKKAIVELNPKSFFEGKVLWTGRKAALTFSIFLLSLFVWFFIRPGKLDINRKFETTEKSKPSFSQQNALEMQPVTVSLPDSRPPEVKVQIEPPARGKGTGVVKNLEDVLRELDPLLSRGDAFETVMDLWKVKTSIDQNLSHMENTDRFYRLAAKKNGFLTQRLSAELNLLKRLDLPAILELRLSGNPPLIYLALTQMDDREITLQTGKAGDVVRVDLNELKTYWSGVAYVPWRDFFGLVGAIPTKSPGDSVIMLKMLLRDIGFRALDNTPVYDRRVKEAVKEIQLKNGLDVDGIVGPLTKIILYNQKKSLKIPHITTS